MTPDEVNDYYYYPLKLNGELVGCPRIVKQYFNCSHSSLTSLRGAPTEVGGNFNARSNLFPDLDGLDTTVGNILFLEENQKFISLCGVHKHLKSCRGISLNEDTLLMGGLGLILIKNLQELFLLGSLHKTKAAFAIIRRCVRSEIGAKGIFKCQKELIDNGFEEYAKL